MNRQTFFKALLALFIGGRVKHFYKTNTKTFPTITKIIIYGNPVCDAHAWKKRYYVTPEGKIIFESGRDLAKRLPHKVTIKEISREQTDIL